VQAQTLVVTCRKGGVGKSSVSILLGGELAERGYKVLLCDCDKQHTASEWAAAAPDSTPFPAAVLSFAAYGAKLHREIEKQIDNYDYIIVDLPPSADAGTVTQSALLIADLAIVVVTPSAPDVRSSEATKALIEGAKVFNEELISVVFANKVERTIISKKLLKNLSSPGMPSLKATFATRTAYQVAAFNGTTVSALGSSANAAATEVKNLTDEILGLLGAKNEKQ
jgi:chromosome partitioning protein